MTSSSTPLQSLALSRSTVDRAAHHRTDERWIADRWAEPSTRVLVVDGDGAAPVAGDPPTLALVPPGEVPATKPDERWFLGIDDDGTALFAVGGGLPDDAGRATLRSVGALLGDRDAGLLTTAVALASWHATHRHCPTCGAPTHVAEAGMVRVCPVDGSLQHPRVDPAVIMAVIDGDAGCCWATRRAGRPTATRAWRGSSSPVSRSSRRWRGRSWRRPGSSWRPRPTSAASPGRSRAA